MTEIIPIIIALLGTAIAGVIDLKTTEIPDWISISMVTGGIFYLISVVISTGNYIPIFNSFILGGAAFILGIIFYFTGQWGGGDSKLLAATIFLIPTVPNIFSPLVIFPFPITIIINIFLIGAVYAVIYAFIYAIIKKEIIRKFLIDIKGRSAKITALLGIGFVTILWIYLYLTFGTSANIVLYSLPGILALIVLWRFLRIVEKEGFVKKINTNDLREGDMIGEDIEKLKIRKRVIRGLTIDEVKKIQKMKKQILVKDGVRFGPVFFFAIIASVYFGDIILLLF